MNINPNEKFLLSSIRISKSNESDANAENESTFDIDWKYISEIAVQRAIAPFIYKKYNASKILFIPDEIKLQFQQSYLKTLTRSILLQDYFKTIAQSFETFGIYVMVLKGIFLSDWLYKDLGLRQFSDIDLLVKEEDGLKCLEILKDLGFKSAKTLESEFVRSQKEIVHYDPMVKDGVSVELHIKLHRSTEKYNLDDESIWKNAVPATVSDMQVFALGKYDLLIHICVHLDKHFKSGYVQFTGFMDIVNLLENYADDKEWEWNELITSCEKYKCLNEVFKYIVLCNKYMNATVPESIINQYGYTLQAKDEELLFKYLNGYRTDGNHHGDQVSGHLRTVGRLKNFADKVHYVKDVVFPSKEFMMQKYYPQPLKGGKSSQQFIPSRTGGARGLWFLWYPYRWWVGVKGVIKLILKKL